MKLLMSNKVEKRWESGGVIQLLDRYLENPEVCQTYLLFKIHFCVLGPVQRKNRHFLSFKGSPCDLY